MTLDSIFRIASMTKPIVSVAAMTPVRGGEALSRRPVADYIPRSAS